MSGKSSGADAGNQNGDAKNRSHHDGSSSRAYTVEQKAAVIRVRRCSPTAFYEILGLEEVKTTCSDGDIKKAYRKLSLLTHPDKNGHEGAEAAFKMVSRAFQVLSDPDKKSKFDKFGGDPDSRYQQASSASSPFSGFARSAGGPGANASMFEDEISPEELFRQFFGGGMGGGFPGFAFDTGPQFVFNLGGGGGPFRVHQFGGGVPRRRPRQGEPEPEASFTGTITQLLPLIFLFIIPLLSSLFSGSTGVSGPQFRVDKAFKPHTHKLYSRDLKIPYWITPTDADDLGKKQKQVLDARVEEHYMTDVWNRCKLEENTRNQLYADAQGWFFNDEEMIAKAKSMKLESCAKWESLKQKKSL